MARRSFFCNATPTAAIYTLSLHDALPICGDEAGEIGIAGEERVAGEQRRVERQDGAELGRALAQQHAELGAHLVAAADRKSTRLNSSHSQISYAVFCLKKKIRFIKAATRK